MDQVPAALSKHGLESIVSACAMTLEARNDSIGLKKARAQVIQSLLKAGANIARIAPCWIPFITRSCYMSPLCIAIGFGRAETARLLLDHGASVLPTEEGLGKEFESWDILTEVHKKVPWSPNIMAVSERIKHISGDRSLTGPNQ